MSQTFDYSPMAWLNRLCDSYPRYAEVFLDGLKTDSEQVLLKDLSERFEAFDLRIGAPYEVLDPRCPYAPSEMRIIRTLLGSLKKFRGSIEGVDSQQLDSAAIDRYVENNERASHNEIPMKFRASMRSFLAHVLRNYAVVDVPGRFGPGAVEEGYSQIMRWRTLFRDTGHDWPSYDPRDPGNPLSGYASLVCGGTACRLRAVPKDWNKKRLITIEPYSNAYLQAYVRERILAAWRETPGLPRDLAALGDPQRINPQMRHMRMALEGSVDGSLATLDLSDASDMVSYNQVAAVMPLEVMADLDRSRSAYYVTEKGAAPRPVEMYAGMGNGTTFVVETMMFHAASYAVAEYYRVPPRDRRISCYGDDIICSPRLARHLIDHFPEMGWKINTLKSYYDENSRFRESCGVQAYQGENVTLLRFMGGKTGDEALISQVDLVRRCCLWSGFYPLIMAPWPELDTVPNSPSRTSRGGLLTSVPWWPDTSSPVRKRWNKGLQTWQWKLPSAVQKAVSCPTKGLGPVYASISGQLQGLTCSADVDTFSRSGTNRKAGTISIPVPNGVCVDYRWHHVSATETRDNWDSLPRFQIGGLAALSAESERKQAFLRGGLDEDVITTAHR